MNKLSLFLLKKMRVERCFQLSLKPNEDSKGRPQSILKSQSAKCEQILRFPTCFMYQHILLIFRTTVTRLKMSIHISSVGARRPAAIDHQSTFFLIELPLSRKAFMFLPTLTQTLWELYLLFPSFTATDEI